MTVRAGEGRCFESCTVSFKGICREHRSDITCKAFCSGRFGAFTVCEANCVHEDDVVYCQCTIREDACP